MPVTRCAVILLASFLGAAGFLRSGHHAGSAVWGLDFGSTSMPPLRFDFAGDDLEPTVPSPGLGSDVNLAGQRSRPGRADVVCRSHEDAGTGPNTTLDLTHRFEVHGSLWFKDAAAPNGSAELDDGTEASARHAVMLGKEMRAVCFGSSWNGGLCQDVVSALRQYTWPRLTAATSGVTTFAHLRMRGEAPPVKTFRSGGGVAADIPCRPGGGKAHLYFRHIYKAAGMAIKKNLAILAQESPKEFRDHRWSSDHLCEEFSKGRSHMSPKPLLFTFVREPMGKFIAGYKEIASRGLIDSFRGTRVGTVAHARLFLDNVFHGSCDNGHVLLQIQNMMGPSCQSRFDYIGKLEELMPHWLALGKAAGCTEELHWPRDWAHASDQDDKGAEAAMRAALAADGGKLARALCVWLLPDYVAFDYPLPEECKAYARLVQAAGVV